MKLLLHVIFADFIVFESEIIVAVRIYYCTLLQYISLYTSGLYACNGTIAAPHLPDRSHPIADSRTSLRRAELNLRTVSEITHKNGLYSLKCLENCGKLLDL